MPAELSMGSRISMRLDRVDDRRLTRAHFSCPCGWRESSSGVHLVVPQAVRDHVRVCPAAQRSLGGAR